MIELEFILKPVDKWPPVGREFLWCDELKGEYQLKVPPFFIKGLSVGDSIGVVKNSLGEVESWKVLKKSKNTTVWIHVKENKSIETELLRLRAFGCNVEKLAQFSLCAVDIPETCSTYDFDCVLDEIDGAKGIVVFPSFRHP